MEGSEDHEQRQSKKWKNRARKEGKNYGVQVPPSSWIKDQRDGEEGDGEGDDGEEEGKKIRVTGFVNGVKSTGKAFVFRTNLPLDEVIKITCNKLKTQYKPIRKLYSEQGNEITDPTQIQQDDNIFLAIKGEDFIQTVHPEDQISVRGTIADLKLNFVEVPVPNQNNTEHKNGKIALYHRPRIQHLNVLTENGCTHLFTILSQKEKADEIQTALEKRRKDEPNTPKWIWLPLPTADPPQDKEWIYWIAEEVKSVVDLLQKGSSVLIHCSDGVHRTGMITNVILRYMGHTQDEALVLLDQMAKLKKDQIGTQRVDWSNEFLDIVGTLQNPKEIPASKHKLKKILRK